MGESSDILGIWCLKFTIFLIFSPTIKEEESSQIVTEKKVYKRCCLEHCHADGNTGLPVTFHKFPSDENVLNLWLRRIDMDKSNITEQSYLCSKHFVPNDYLGEKINCLICAFPKGLRSYFSDKTKFKMRRILSFSFY